MIRKKVESFMKQHNMVQQGDTVIVGVSGGADSVCLLWILKELKMRHSFHLVAVHVHHGIRGAEADEDENYVEMLCKQWNIPCEKFHVDVPNLAKSESLTLEEAGRKVRYEAFSQVAEKYNQVKIAVAHHMDDNTETILMNLFRGSGLKGISGMEPVREQIIRPMLCVRKSEIEQALKEQSICWKIDATNLETDYTRNKMRLQVIPTILEVFPQAEEQILQMAQIASETDTFLNKLAYKFIDKNATFGYNEVVWKKEAFLKEDMVMQKVIVRQMFLKSGMGLKDITSKHIEDICGLGTKQVGKEIQLPYGWKVKVGYDVMHLYHIDNWDDERKNLRNENQHMKATDMENVDDEVWNKAFQLDVSIFSNPFYEEDKTDAQQMENDKKNVKFSKNQYTKWFDYDKIKDAVVLRTRKSGDRIQVNPIGSKKLKDYMIDAKIPKDIRDRIPIVASGNQVLWVVGYRMSEAFKVTAQTRTIMQIILLEQ